MFCQVIGLGQSEPLDHRQLELEPCLLAHNWPPWNKLKGIWLFSCVTQIAKSFPRKQMMIQQKRMSPEKDTEEWTAADLNHDQTGV